LIYFKLILVKGGKQGSSFSFCHAAILPATFLEEAVLGFFVEDQLAVAVWVYVWVFYSDPLVFPSVFVPMLFYVYCYGSVILFEVGNTSSIGLCAQSFCGYSRSFVFPYLFLDHFFYLCEECHLYIDRVCIKFVGFFGQHRHFHNVDATSPRALEIPPSSDVFLDFSLQWFVVFIEKVSDFLC
jgi:hypothetical protein